MIMVKNRGALINPEGRFETQAREDFYDEWYVDEQETATTLETTLLKDNAKTIINRR